MLTIRLQRIGRKNDPSFRVVVTDSRNGPKSGRSLETLGTYNPKLSAISLNADRIKHWMLHGATLSGTVHNMLITKGIIEGKKINVLSRKSLVKAEPSKDAVATPPEVSSKTPASVERVVEAEAS